MFNNMLNIINRQDEKQRTKVATLRDARISNERVGGHRAEEDLILALVEIGLHPRKEKLIETKGAEFEENQFM